MSEYLIVNMPIAINNYLNQFRPTERWSIENGGEADIILGATDRLLGADLGILFAVMSDFCAATSKTGVFSNSVNWT